VAESFTGAGEESGRNLIDYHAGTSNQFGPENTNVVRLVQLLDRNSFTYSSVLNRLRNQPLNYTFPNLSSGLCQRVNALTEVPETLEYTA
jgi:hypothetical protein